VSFSLLQSQILALVAFSVTSFSVYLTSNKKKFNVPFLSYKQHPLFRELFLFVVFFFLSPFAQETNNK
jgi:hypothetical protein